MTGEDECCAAVPTCYGPSWWPRRLRSTAAKVLRARAECEGLRSCEPISANFAENFGEARRRRGLLLLRQGAGASYRRQREAVRRQWRGGDSPEHRSGIDKGWPSMEKKELTAELEKRTKALNNKLKG